MLKPNKSKKVFVIAEAGVNHNGDIELAKRMIEVAKESGADAVKFQTFKAENLLIKNAKKAKYQIVNSEFRESQYEMLRRLEFNKSDFKQLASYARQKKIIFLSSPFDKDSVDLLDEIGIPLFKIASGEITNLPLLKYIARKGKPIILSTGMSNLIEIEEALNLIKKQGLRDITLLHCVTNYPAKIEDVNLRAMQTLREVFKVPVGFSDHTLGITIAIAAVAQGACVIEKHFTLDKDFFGSDHRASIEPDELKEMIWAIRDVEKACGNGCKKPNKNEEEIKKIVRKSIVAKIDIPKGTRITQNILDTKRPATGIEPKFLNRVVGKIAKRNIRQDTLIKFKDLI